jgi:hypothetical protein
MTGEAAVSVAGMVPQVKRSVRPVLGVVLHVGAEYPLEAAAIVIRSQSRRSREWDSSRVALGAGLRALNGASVHTATG